MDSLSKMLDRLKPNQKDFNERFINITSVYNAPFDSDTVIRYLEEGTLKESENSEGIVYIPEILYNKDLNQYIIPTKLFIDGEEFPLPDSIEEFRAFCLSKDVFISLNTETAKMLFN